MNKKVPLSKAKSHTKSSKFSINSFPVELTIPKAEKLTRGFKPRIETDEKH